MWKQLQVAWNSIGARSRRQRRLTTPIPIWNVHNDFLWSFVVVVAFTRILHFSDGGGVSTSQCAVVETFGPKDFIDGRQAAERGTSRPAAPSSANASRDFAKPL